MRLTRIAAAMAAALGASMATAASAAVFDFSYSGPGIDASGTFTTTDTADVDGYFTITSLTGQRNGVDMTLLTPGTFPDDGANDNLVQPFSNFFTFAGVGFSTDQDYNVFQFATDVYVECFGACLVDDVTEVFLDKVSVTPAGSVPEPAEWALMLAGFGLAGATLRSRRAALVRG